MFGIYKRHKPFQNLCILLLQRVIFIFEYQIWIGKGLGILETIVKM